MPHIVLGTVQLGMPYGINNQAGQPTLNQAFEILHAAQKHGICILDTADAYGEAMQRIGKFHAVSAAPPFRIITKFHTSQSFSASLLDGARQALSVLRVPVLYCYQFHRASDALDTAAAPVLYKQLALLKEQGIIERIGVSVYSNEEFAAVINQPQIDVIQLPFNVFDNMNHRGALMHRAKAAGKELHVRSVFLQGLLFRSSIALPPHLATLAPVLEALHAIAANGAMDIATLALNYVLHNPLVDAVLIGVDTAAQLLELLDAQRPAFDAELVRRIESLPVLHPDVLNPSRWHILEQLSNTKQ
jgi:aryl-alcohol dehydrogenase-like predicted oxidoreductase